MMKGCVVTGPAALMSLNFLNINELSINTCSFFYSIIDLKGMVVIKYAKYTNSVLFII